MTSSADRPAPKWQPLSSIDRRVAGVLVEKAKTTPENYPLTLNSIRVACNQKNNRFPLTNFEADHVEDSLERLRGLGAVAEIVGDGRTSKFRHLLYEWLGVEKVEMAVMAELLLRGAQTVGELRGRAARMEPIADLAALQPVLDSLEAKRLIVYLTPSGRGTVLTHNLYAPSELQRLRQEHGGSGTASVPHATVASPQPTYSPAAPAAPAASRPTATAPAPSAPRESDVSAADMAALRRELAETRTELADLATTTAALQSDLDEIKRQLGI